MSLPIPLAIRLSTARGDRHVTAEARDLSMRWTDPGGYASCRVSLDRPLSLQPDEISYYGDMTVYDARSGEVVWDGRLEDPGRSAGSNGQVWELTGVGGQAHTRDRVVPLMYVDSSLQSFVRVDNATPGGDSSVTADPGDAGAGTAARQAIVMRFPMGLAVAVGSRIVMRHSGPMATGQKLSRVAYSWDAGLSTPNLAVQAVTRTDGNIGTGEVPSTQAWSTAGGSASAVVGAGAGTWPNGRNTVELWAQVTATSGTITADTWWASFYNLCVRTLLLTRAGVEITTGYTANTVLASEVVADLLGRLLTEFDGAGATIATTTHPIDQLAYLDGVDSNRILTDLLALEAGHTWRVWERNSAGKFRFEWTAIPTSVRYEADVVDGYEAPGSADGLYNRVTVRWRDSAGQVQTTTRTATVPILDDAGLVRQGQIDLGDEVGSLADAQRAGDQWLADRAYPANAGRLRISRPIMDLESGRMVDPWEIRPGLIRVRGVLPRPDALNASRDGVTIFRIISSEFRASDASATLELDSYAPSTARALADLQRRPVYRRR